MRNRNNLSFKKNVNSVSLKLLEQISLNIQGMINKFRRTGILSNENIEFDIKILSMVKEMNESAKKKS